MSNSLKLIIFIALLLVYWASGYRKLLLRISLINIGLIVVYNILAWEYNFQFFLDDTPTGVGLLVLFVTGMHIFLLTVYIILTLVRNKKTP